jgi:cobalt/nickel transport protein
MKNILLWPKKWIIAMTALIIASPLGILIVWGGGGAWGEWSSVGNWVPQQFWNAPFADYDLGGWDGQLMASLGYIISAIVGIAAIIILTYILYIAVSKRENRELSK